VALPSIDSVPVAYIKTDEEDKPLVMPFFLSSWMTNLVDALNEALLQIDARLTAGGL
jgi:hypothetical protein